MTPTRNDLRPYGFKLLDDYTAYINGVSEPTHAVSLESAAMLWWYCAETKARNVCDLGSGFSSYVLRRYAESVSYPVQVTSVDTDETWMVRTAQFTAGSDGDLMLWDDWVERGGTYDVIFHDIANGTFREQALTIAAERLIDGGILIFDDAQHDGHRRAFRQLADTKSWPIHDTLDATLDVSGRYALVAEAVSMDLAVEYEQVASIPSDIYLHLPRMVELVESLNAQHVIELGTRTGVSTLAWLYGLVQTGGRLTSVDIDERPMIGRWPHWTFIQGDDCDPAVIEKLEPADIVFIDTSHLYEHTVRELDLYLGLVKPGGLIVCHDTQLEHPIGAPPLPRFPVRTAIVEFVEAHGFDWHEFTDCFGLGIVKVG